MAVVIQEQLKLLVELQKFDSEIHRLKKEASEHPILRKKAETEFGKKKAALKTAEEAFKARQLDQKKKEGDLAAAEEKIKKLQSQLYLLKTNKEYQAMEMEIKGLKADKSLVEEDKLDVAKKILNDAKNAGVNIYIPVDAIIADNFSNEANHKPSDVKSIPDGWMGLDIGKETEKIYADVISKSKTILWNGPMGVFEMSNFEHGTKAVAVAVAEATAKGAYSLIGGGDSVAAINKYRLADKVSYVSTGGGALLEYIESGTLPGVEAVEK